MLEVLIGAGAEVDVKDPLGRSALSRAQKRGFSKIAELLEATLALKKTAESPTFFKASKTKEPEECKQHTPPKSPRPGASESQ